MKLERAGIFVIIFSMILVIGACQKATPPVLKEIGPTQTKAAVAFNVQPDGSAAMWFKSENATKDIIIMMGDKQLRTDFHDAGLLTSPVPKELYAKSGKYEVYLKDPKTGAKSNSLFFTVTE